MDFTIKNKTTEGELKTTLAVMKALGIELTAKVAAASVSA